MMNKKFLTPELEILYFGDDIITTSDEKHSVEKDPTDSTDEFDVTN